MAASNSESPTDSDVLVVEDDREINQLVGAYVELAGFRYRAAFNGEEALDQLRNRAPSLIVLDLMLPDLSGWEICRRVRHAQDTHDVLVIILTALDSDASRQEGRLCGANDYLTKPFDPQVFMQTLKKLGSPAA